MRIFSMAGLTRILFALTVVRLTAVPVAQEQISPDWGMADVLGVQMRLRAVKHEWQSNETPSLTLDLRNTGSKTALYFGMAQMCLIEVDGHWYTWSEPILINQPPSQLFPGQEKDRAITIQLTDVWFRSQNSDATDWDGVSMGDAKGIIYLRLSPGKHTVRVKFRPGDPDTTIAATSNEVETACSAAATPQH
jgi:hypothetical protein